MLTWIDFGVLADFIGITAFAIAGIVAATGMRVDPVGIFVLAFTTAFGGGLLRDLIIDARPFYWVNNEAYVWLTLALAAFAPWLMRRFRKGALEKLLIWCDAVGLGFFSVSGTALCLDYGMPLLASTMLGVCTGVMGGLLRDVMLNRVPMVLSNNQPYASAAFAGCWLYIAMHLAGLGDQLALWTSTFLIIAVRMYCWYQDLRLIRYGLLRDWQKAQDDEMRRLRAKNDRLLNQLQRADQERKKPQQPET